VPAAFPPLRVLLVDDDPAFAELIDSVLSRAGIEVVAHAFDGAEGVELASRFEPDVIVMDIRMPVMDGLEATRKILETSPHASVLVVSSSKDREDVQRALQAGAIGYVPKDRAIKELAGRLEQFRPPGAAARSKPAPYRLVGWKVLEVA
jgi:DNA-binding NarL/FixJ family response regulator